MSAPFMLHLSASGPTITVIVLGAIALRCWKHDDVPAMREAAAALAEIFGPEPTVAVPSCLPISA